MYIHTSRLRCYGFESPRAICMVSLFYTQYDTFVSKGKWSDVQTKFQRFYFLEASLPHVFLHPLNGLVVQQIAPDREDMGSNLFVAFSYIDDMIWYPKLQVKPSSNRLRRAFKQNVKKYDLKSWQLFSCCITKII